MKITQAVLRYCSLYGITFNDKYSDIKSIVTTDNYKSTSTNNSQTSTVLSTNNSYYNRVEKCELYQCDVEDGTFVDCDFIGTSGLTNYINNGTFSGCTFTGYIINGGKFYNCKVFENNIWEGGFWDNTNGTDDFLAAWHDGIWNRGHFASSYGWTGGTFNNGIFEYPAIWYNGIANGGTFRTTWYNGLVRNANFSDSIFNNGTFNKGNFSGGNWNGGIFNDGLMSSTIISGGTICGGTIYRGYLYNCNVKGGNFNRTKVYSGSINMQLGDELIVYGGNFYGGKYNGGIYLNCHIYNGQFENLATNVFTGITIHNGIFSKCDLKNSYINSGNFTNCSIEDSIWEYGVFTEGSMIGCRWYDGYWNDSEFLSKINDQFTLIQNGAGLGTTDWTGATSGLAAGWVLLDSGFDYSYSPASIVTGNGFLGNAQRIRSYTGGDFYGIYSDTYTLKSGVEYKLSFTYRCYNTSPEPLIISDTLENLNMLSTGLTIIQNNNTGNAVNLTITRTFNEGSYLLFYSNTNVNAWFEIDKIDLIDSSTNTSVWYDGHFYGGNFSGVWLGGTFHYGTKYGIVYEPLPKNKWLITNIKTSKNSPPPAF